MASKHRSTSHRKSEIVFCKHNIPPMIPFEHVGHSIGSLLEPEAPQKRVLRVQQARRSWYLVREAATSKFLEKMRRLFALLEKKSKKWCHRRVTNCQWVISPTSVSQMKASWATMNGLWFVGQKAHLLNVFIDFQFEIFSARNSAGTTRWWVDRGDVHASD